MRWRPKIRLHKVARACRASLTVFSALEHGIHGLGDRVLGRDKSRQLADNGAGGLGGDAAHATHGSSLGVGDRALRLGELGMQRRLELFARLLGLSVELGSGLA